MRKYLTYILMLGFPLLGAQTKVAEKAAYQEKWTSLDTQNTAMAFDADVKLSDAEIALDKKLFQIRKQFLTETEKQHIPLYSRSFNEIKP